MKAVISTETSFITFVQTWTTSSPENQERWLSTMHRRIGALTGKPGFVSMTLHRSDEGKKIAVYAQWRSEAELVAAVGSPEAKAGHDELAQWGTSEGALYRVADVYGPTSAPAMTATRAEAPAGFAHADASVNGVRIHYVIGGRGAPLVLLHGWPETWYAWRKVLPALAERFTVVAPDMRGLGDSSRPDAGYDKATVAQDIYELANQLKLGPFAVVGSDMGGPVAFRLAADHEPLITSIVLVETSISGFGFEAALDITHGGSWHFGLLMSDFAEMLIQGREREFLRAFAYQGGCFEKDAILEPDVDEYIRSYAATGGMGLGYYRTLWDDARANAAFKGRTLAMPALAVDGEHGFRTSFGSLSQVARNVKHVVVPGAGHWIAEEQPEAFLREVIPFLESNAGGGEA
jgi:pimeloyl-ACP methyl ester carboxylesterase/heme-degrading monooxygenase HmoA